MGPSYQIPGGSGIGSGSSGPPGSWIGRVMDPGLRSKLTSFSWKDIDDSDRLSGDAVLS